VIVVHRAVPALADYLYATSNESPQIAVVSSPTSTHPCTLPRRQNFCSIFRPEHYSNAQKEEKNKNRTQPSVMRYAFEAGPTCPLRVPSLSPAALTLLSYSANPRSCSTGDNRMRYVSRSSVRPVRSSVTAVPSASCSTCIVL
jgi:hypothetical protein